MTTEEPLTTGHAALAAGRWGEARTAFEAALAHDELAHDETAPDETAQACFGLAAKGRWDDAERELGAGLRITDGIVGAQARRVAQVNRRWSRVLIPKVGWVRFRPHIS